MLGVSRCWLYHAAADGLIPCLRLGRTDGPVRLHPDDLAAWIEQARAAWRPGDSTADTLRRAARARWGTDDDQDRELRAPGAIADARRGSANGERTRQPCWGRRRTRPPREDERPAAAGRPRLLG